MVYNIDTGKHLSICVSFDKNDKANICINHSLGHVTLSGLQKPASVPLPAYKPFVPLPDGFLGFPVCVHTLSRV